MKPDPIHSLSFQPSDQIMRVFVRSARCYLSILCEGRFGLVRWDLRCFMSIVIFFIVLQSGIVFLSDVTYELQSINPRLCQYRCDNDNENAFVLKRAPTINHTWTDGFGTVTRTKPYTRCPAKIIHIAITQFLLKKKKQKQKVLISMFSGKKKKKIEDRNFLEFVILPDVLTLQIFIFVHLVIGTDSFDLQKNKVYQFHTIIAFWNVLCSCSNTFHLFKPYCNPYVTSFLYAKRNIKNHEENVEMFR